MEHKPRLLFFFFSPFSWSMERIIQMLFLNKLYKEIYCLRLPLVWLGHNSRKRFCRQEGEVMSEHADHWLVGWWGSAGLVLTLFFKRPDCLPKQPLPRQTTAGRSCYPPLLCALGLLLWICPNVFKGFLENNTWSHMFYIQSNGKMYLYFIFSYRIKEGIWSSSTGKTPTEIF